MFYEVFPVYLTYGMTPDQFWHDDPHLAYYYREAYKMRQDAENQSQWRQGLYFLDALAVALGNLFSSKNKLKYPEKPYQIRPKTKAEKEKEVEEARKKAIEDFKKFGAFLESKFGEKNG